MTTGINLFPQGGDHTRALISERPLAPLCPMVVTNDWCMKVIKHYIDTPKRSLREIF